MTGQIACHFFAALGDCILGEWRCDNSQCVTKDKRCDGTVDCSDQSDEMRCDGKLYVLIYVLITY